MKKFFLFVFFLLLSFILIPEFTNAGLVPCDRNCTIADFFTMINNIYNFIVWTIATPLAVLMITIGGIIILASAGNPNLANTGKGILKWSILGLVLVFGAWVIINFIMTTLGYRWGAWNVLY